MKKIAILLIFIMSFSLAFEGLVTTRVKDISRLLNQRNNQLIGYGLVVGLAGTGDNDTDTVTMQGISNMLSNFGVQVDPSRIKAGNVAAVMVTAKLGPFNVPGDMVDVQVSSIGQARSLRGGTLLLTPLKAANGEVYAVAQGSISLGAYSVSSKRSSQSQNHNTAGAIPNGAIIEKGVETVLDEDGVLTWVLDYDDFATVRNICTAITDFNSDLKVMPLSAAKFSIEYPKDMEISVVELIAQIGELEIGADNVAKIIINEKTGAVVMGGPVKIAPVVIAHQNLNIEIQNTQEVSQPNALSGGQTKVTNRANINVNNSAKNKSLEIVKTSDNTVEKVVALLNNIGVTPGDVIIILQMMKEAGAIKAKLEII